MHNHYITLKFRVSLFAFFLLGNAAIANNGKYPIKNFTPVEYQAGIQNIDFTQNRDMTLFVANNLGVLAFNGNEWELHASRTGKKQRSLAFDSRTNRLYVGSQGEFGYFENDWNYVSLADKIPAVSRDFDEVWDVFILDANIYFCTFQGIYAYNGESIFVVDGENNLNKSFRLGNRLFTQNSDGKLFEIKDFKLTAAYPQIQTEQIVAGLIQKEDGYLVFYNSGEIEFSTSFGTDSHYPELIKVLAGKYVNHVTQLSDTRLVISTQRSGLYLFDMQTNTIENITADDGLQSNACLRAFQDHSGNLWVGMQNGMALIDIDSPLRLINEEINLQGSGYDAFDTDEGTYYTTSNGIYFQSKGARQCLFLKGTEGPAYGIQKIFDKLYAGHHTGLFLLAGGVAKRVANTNGLWEVKLLRSNPKYAIGGTYSGLFLFKINAQEELEGIQKIDGFDESSRFFEEDSRGRIWVGQFYKGLYQLTLNEQQTIAVVKKVSDSNMLPIKEHVLLTRIDDELYVSTEAGVYKIDQSTDEIIEATLFSENVGNYWIYLLVQGLQKNIYVYTENSVGYYKPISATNYTYLPSSLFQLRHSFNNDLLNVSINVDDGVLFNANEGFIYYNPALENRFSTSSKPLIRRVYGVAEEHVLFERMPFENRKDSTQQIVITEGLKVLQFTVESFKFGDVGNRQYRYLLKGFDDEYGEWTSATIKEYTNLPTGRYEFYVQTLNSFGEQVTSDAMMLNVEPPFYNSLWMKIVFVLLALAALFNAYRLQKQYYKRKARKLEEVKEEELTLKQKEVQRLKEEQNENELRHVNNLLAASKMNLVVKNEFMENIKEELKEVNLITEISERRVALNQIVKEIDKTLKLQDDWKQFEFHFDQVHGDFLTRLTQEFTDLTPGEQKLCAFLRLKMDTKEIANLMNISLRGVEIARYRLRKKFNLNTNQNLSKFVLEY